MLEYDINAGWEKEKGIWQINTLMVKRSIRSQKVVNCDGAILPGCPCAAVDIFDIVNGVRTKQKSFTGGLIP